MTSKTARTLLFGFLLTFIVGHSSAQQCLGCYESEVLKYLKDSNQTYVSYVSSDGHKIIYSAHVFFSHGWEFSSGEVSMYFIEIRDQKLANKFIKNTDKNCLRLNTKELYWRCKHCLIAHEKNENGDVFLYITKEYANMQSTDK